MANSFENGGGGSTASDMAQMAAGIAIGQQMINNMQNGAAAAPQPQAPVPPVAPAAPVQSEAAAAEAEKTVQEVFEELKGPNFCPYCGKQVNGANYCPYCGKKLI